jgi:hypothetical protein
VVVVVSVVKSIVYSYQQYSHNQHTHLQYVIRLPVSAQRAIIRPMPENHENQTPYILIRGKTPPFFTITLLYTDIYIYVIVKMGDFSSYQNVRSLIFMVFWHRPDDEPL